jgi:hypothetical protein
VLQCCSAAVRAVGACDGAPQHWWTAALLHRGTAIRLWT